MVDLHEPLTVGELIEALRQFPEDRPVMAGLPGHWGDVVRVAESTDPISEGNIKLYLQGL
jgi:hypothetical protein